MSTVSDNYIEYTMFRCEFREFPQLLMHGEVRSTHMKHGTADSADLPRKRVCGVKPAIIFIFSAENIYVPRFVTSPPSFWPTGSWPTGRGWAERSIPGIFALERSARSPCRPAPSGPVGTFHPHLGPLGRWGTQV